MGTSTTVEVVSPSTFDPLLEFVDKPNDAGVDGRRSARFIRVWWCELGSLTISLVGFISLCLLLQKYDGQTLSEWTLVFSFNTFISIISTVIKASMLMPIGEGIALLKWTLVDRRPRTLMGLHNLDQASRGSWGSVKLILSILTGKERPYLAAVGGLIMILGLGIGPVTQAIVRYYPCTRISTSAVASVPRAITYNASVSAGGNQAPTLDQGMQLAIYMGLLDPPSNSSSIVPVTCLSGNCTFSQDGLASFSTLAVCSSCSDISALITSPQKGNYSLSVDPSSKGAKISAEGDMVSVSDASTNSTLFGFKALIMTSYASLYNSTLEPLAVQCSLVPCVKTYAANVSNSIYSETELNSTLLQPMNNDSYIVAGDEVAGFERWGFFLPTDRILRNGVRPSCESSPNRTDTNVVKVVTNSSTVWYPRTCVWYYNAYSVNAAKHMLQRVMAQVMYSTEQSTSQGPTPTWLQVLWSNGKANMTSITTFMSGLAISMSRQIRLNSADDKDTKLILGDVLDSQTCIEVRWQYLSFLTTLIVADMVFCAIVIVSWEMSNLHMDWKSSILPVLFHGLDQIPTDQIGHVPESMEDMLRTAKGTRIQLQHGDRGWMLYRKF